MRWLPLEYLYHLSVQAKRLMYRRVLPPKRLPRPVFSIGGIGSGGAGKTPAVIAVCRHLEQQGLRVAVLTRGYKREHKSITGRVTSLDAKKYGDEAVLIKSSIQGEVIVGESRYRNALIFMRDFDCDVFVLDDGFQHVQLHRDLDIVIDAPARYHRELPSAFRHADLVLPRRLRTIVPESLRGQRVFAFSGLANNEQFFASLRDAGLDVVGTRGFGDHYRYSPADLETIRRDAEGAQLVTSGKDAVKIADPSIVAVGAEFVIEQETLDQIVSGVAGRMPADRQAGSLRSRKRRKSALLERIEYSAFRFVARCVRSMSDEAIYRWGSRLGALGGKVLGRRDRLAKRNLRATFPERSESELRTILDECWRHFGRELLQYVKLQNASAEEIAAACPLVNEELLREAMARGKGTLVISGHWGGWEIGGLAAMSLLKNVKTVARPLDNTLLERDLTRLREKTGTEVVDRKRAARVLLRGLTENGVVVLLTDQAVQRKEGVLVPFLGRPAWTTPVPAKLALRTGATIVFAFCKADGLRHRLEFTEAIRADLLSEDERDPVNLTKRINDVISARITARPELWLWMHDRWKGTGESEVTNGV